MHDKTAINRDDEARLQPRCVADAVRARARATRFHRDWRGCLLLAIAATRIERRRDRVGLALREGCLKVMPLPRRKLPARGQCSGASNRARDRAFVHGLFRAVMTNMEIAA